MILLYLPLIHYLRAIQNAFTRQRVRGLAKIVQKCDIEAGVLAKDLCHCLKSVVSKIVSKLIYDFLL